MHTYLPTYLPTYIYIHICVCVCVCACVRVWVCFRHTIIGSICVTCRIEWQFAKSHLPREYNDPLRLREL